MRVLGGSPTAGRACHSPPLPSFPLESPPSHGASPQSGAAKGPGWSVAAACQRRAGWGRKEEGDSAEAQGGERWHGDDRGQDPSW